MKTGTAAMLAVGTIVGISLLRKSTAADHLNYFVDKIAIKFDGITPVLRVDLGIQNPSEVKFIIKSISGNLFDNGFKIGTVSQFETMTINATSEVIYPVFVRLDVFGGAAIVTDLVKKILGGGGIAQNLEFDGVVNENGMLVPINFTYSIF